MSGDPVSGNNGLFYVLSDHLDSTSLLATGSGSVVGGSTTRYLPFGGYRPGSAPTQAITDRDFTGQKENMELGLLYYQARFYVPGIGRFASADTLVPDPMNPQSLNRYSYALNNPLRYTDPTGHCGADTAADGGMDLALFEQCTEIQNELMRTYDIKITGYWLLSEMGLLRDSLQGIIDRFTAMGIGQAMDAFHDIWSGVRLNRVRTHSSATAWTKSKNRIDIHNGTFLDTTVTNGQTAYSPRSADGVFGTVAHELAHIWDRRSGRDLSEGLREAVGGQYEHKFLFWEWGEYTVGDRSPYRDGSPNPPNQGEDWAYTFQALMVDPMALEALNPLKPERYQYISGVMCYRLR